MTILYSYFVIAGEFIAQIVEAPFGKQEDNLDLEGICRNIDRSVSEVLLDHPQD
jgi:predicted membrane chloride channel (bestrophin family)